MFKRYIIVPPRYPAVLDAALGLFGSEMLFKSEEDAREAIKFLGVENPDHHTVHVVAVSVDTY